MNLLLAFAAIATGAIVLAAVALIAYLRSMRRQPQPMPDPAWFAAYLRSNPAFVQAVNAEIDVTELRAAIDAWEG